MRLQHLIGNHIIIKTTTTKLFDDMLYELVYVEKSPQSESVKVRGPKSVKLLHWATEVDCFVVTKISHPEYFL